MDGAGDFHGKAFHTARWPADLDLTDKRVAVIGSGCTGYQMVPELADRAGHTYLFQRTPNWCWETRGYRHPYPDQVTWLDRNFPYYTNFMRFRINWIVGPEAYLATTTVDPTFRDPHARSAVNKRMRDERLTFMRKKFADRPELMEKMTPVAPPMSARPVLVDADYSIYDALLRDDVTLVSEGIRRLTRDGIEDRNGVEYPVDVIVFATGFKANDFLWPMEVRGRHGRRLEELWEKDGARVYLGTMLPGFPNFFMLYGPNSNPAAGLGAVTAEELVTRFALKCMEHLIVNGARTVDVTPEAYQRFNDELDRREATRMYRDPRADSYMQNELGRSAAQCPFPPTELWTWLRAPEDRRGNGRADAAPAAGTVNGVVSPHFGEDLIVE